MRFSAYSLTARSQFSANAPDQIEEEKRNYTTQIILLHSPRRDFSTTTTIVRLSTLQTGFIFVSSFHFFASLFLCSGFYAIFRFRNGW
jgi:hypothetical protein